MFAPFVPWMMHGEIFNATHLGVPGIFDYSVRGKLLHSYLDWDDLERQQDVVEDFMKIMNIRKEHKDIFHNNRYETNLINVPFASDRPSDAKPYARFIKGEKAAIVIGNPDPYRENTFRLNIPLADLGLADEKELVITDLWTGQSKSAVPQMLEDYSVEVPGDKQAGGGVRVLLLRGMQ